MYNNNILRKHNCESCTLDNCFISKYCSPTWKTIINQRKTVIRYKKGQQVFYQDNIVHGMYFICSGKVKIFKNGYAGKTKIIRLAKSGDILGHRGYGGDDIYPVSATVMDDSEISFIENDIYIESLKVNPELTYRLMLFYAEELKNSESQLLYLAYMSSEERVAEALLKVSDVFGVKLDNKICLDIVISRQEIADMVGLSAGQVIRVLSDLKQKGIIETQSKRIYIKDPDALNAITMHYRSASLSDHS